MTSWVRISDHRGFAAVGDAVGGSSDDQNSRQLKLLSNHHTDIPVLIVLQTGCHSSVKPIVSKH